LIRFGGKSKLTLGVLAALGAVAGVAAATVGSASAGADSASAVEGFVQVIQPGVHPYVAAGNKGVLRESKKLGVKVQITQSEFTPAKEIANIQNAIAKGAKAIVIQPASSQGVVPKIEEAVKEGICVVAFAVNVGSSKYVDKVYPGLKGFVGLNEYQSGQEMGASLAKAMGGKGNVVVIQGILPSTAAGGREDGARDYWKKHNPGIKVLASQQAYYDAEKARALMQNYLQRFGAKINAVLSITNNMGVAAADVIAKSPYKGKIAISSTGGEKQFIDYIKQGKATSTVVEVPTDEAGKAFDLAVDCMKGNKKPVFFNTNQLPAAAVLKSQGYVVNKSNIGKFKPQW
jgi:ABC-type sugar transport system substrate-binding protein